MTSRRTFLKTSALLPLLGYVRPTSARQSTNSGRFIDRLSPAPVGGGFRMDGYWVWCGSVVQSHIDGRYHMFASRWPRNLAFAPNWMSNSEIVRAVADKPEGPYTFQEVVFAPRGAPYWDGRMTHNPTIHKHGDTYLLFYVGTTYDEPTPTPASQLIGGSPLQIKIRGNQRIGLATAPSPEGPWVRADKPILDVSASGFDSYLVTNPAPCVGADGSVLLVYKGAAGQPSKLHLGVAKAPHYTQPFVKQTTTPLFPAPAGAPHPYRHVEDAYIWREDGQYHLIMKDMDGSSGGEKGGGLYATSADGVDWQLAAKPQAYSRKVRWSDGQVRDMAAFERPQLLIQNGKPTHLFAATGRNAEGAFWKFDETWNMCIPLKA
jgi:hypothetical protein